MNKTKHHKLQNITPISEREFNTYLTPAHDTMIGVDNWLLKFHNIPKSEWKFLDMKSFDGDYRRYLAKVNSYNNFADSINRLLDEVKNFDNNPEPWPPQRLYEICPKNHTARAFLGEKQFLLGKLDRIFEGHLELLEISKGDYVLDEEGEDIGNFLISYVDFIESDSEGVYYDAGDQDFDIRISSYTEADWRKGKVLTFDDMKRKWKR